MNDLNWFFNSFLFWDMHKCTFPTKGRIQSGKGVSRIGNGIKILFNDLSKFRLTQCRREQAYIHPFMRGFGEERTIYSIDKHNFKGVNIVKDIVLYFVKGKVFWFFWKNGIIRFDQFVEWGIFPLFHFFGWKSLLLKSLNRSRPNFSKPSRFCGCRRLRHIRGNKFFL